MTFAVIGYALMRWRWLSLSLTSPLPDRQRRPLSLSGGSAAIRQQQLTERTGRSARKCDRLPGVDSAKPRRAQAVV